MRHNRTDMDDHGFTLIEVLIAMVILAIIVVPLLHTFISSSQTNLKARRTLRMTTAAQDIMEGLKAYTIEELVYQFNFPAVRHASNPLIDVNNEFHVINPSLIHGDIKELKFDGSSYIDVVQDPNKNLTTASIYSTDTGETYEFLGARDPANPTSGVNIGKYYFQMADVSLQDDASITFDALVELDATPYRTGGGKNPELNAKEIVGIKTMNNLYDAFYVATENDVYNAVQNMNTIYSPATEIKEENVKRTITIDVDQNVVAGKTDVKATIKIKYLAEGFGTGGTDIEYEPLGATGKQIYGTTTEDMELRNVYLFYFPMYNDAAHQDEIIFNNNNPIELQLHIVKQEPTSATSALIAKESSYHCAVEINDTGIGSAADSATKLVTNLTTNLYEVNAPITALGTLYTPSGNVKYQFNGFLVSETDLGVKNLAGTAVKDRIYDVTIRIYEPGAAAAGFPNTSLVTTLTGSKDN